MDRNGFRYEFDALSGRARVCDVRDPSVDLLPAHPEMLSDLRMLIEREAGTTLEALQERYHASATALRELGYL